MTSLLLGALLMQGSSAFNVLEFPDPSSDRIVLQAIIQLPELQSQEWGAAYVYAETLFEGTEQYSKHQLLDYGSQTGESPRVIVMPDHIRISMCFPKGQLDIGSSMLASLIKSPTLPEDKVNKALIDLPLRKRELWEEALWPSVADFTRFRPETVLQFCQRYVRPENLTVLAAGAFAPGEFIRQWKPRMEGWNPIRPRNMPLQTGPRKPIDSHTSPVGTYELALPPVTVSNPSFPTQLLALYAIAVGKGSSLFKTVREEFAWSYRQEGFLWPTPLGFQPRLIWASSRKREEISWQKARDAMVADAQKWTQSNFDRALAMAEATLARGEMPVPFYLSPKAPLSLGVSPSSSLRDKSFLAAYWQLKTGKDWDPEGLVSAMRAVKLDDLKTTATEMLRAAFPRVIPAARDK